MSQVAGKPTNTGEKAKSERNFLRERKWSMQTTFRRVAALMALSRNADRLYKILLAEARNA
jgi:hypothetical protein